MGMKTLPRRSVMTFDCTPGGRTRERHTLVGGDEHDLVAHLLWHGRLMPLSAI